MDEAEKLPATTFIVCGVVIEKDGKYLLVQEKQAKVYGKWNLPAGRVDEGETLEQAAIRETKEECGYDVELVKHVLTVHPAVDKPVLHAWTAIIAGGELQGLSECMMRTIYGSRPYQTWLETPDLLNGHIREYEVST